jgi:beta-glucosidase
MQTVFPDDFLWGTATAAHQVEGNNVNNDVWLLEHVPETLFAEPSGDAIDHYHRFAEDIALLAELGFNMYRFSLEWSRIEPAEGEFSQAILDHYRRMLAACHEHGLTPMVTFHHFTSPRWLMTKGGWEAEATPVRFARFCGRATEALGDLIGAACTLNEANIGPLLTHSGMLPPREARMRAPWWQAAAKAVGVAPARFLPFIFATSEQARDVILTAHRRATEAIKAVNDEVPVGLSLAIQDIQAGPGGEAYAARMQHEINNIFLEAVRGDDFVGVQSYSRQRFGPEGPLPPEAGVPLTQMGYEFWPEALEAAIRHAIAIAEVPVIVTENGIGTDDDAQRITYVRRALQGVEACLADGLDVRGYTYWSGFDNFEWMMGYTPTFGLIAVDRETQKRKLKPSAWWLGDVARVNGLSVYEATVVTGRGMPGRQCGVPAETEDALGYWLFLPEEYGEKEEQRWPLILYLHGIGERGDVLAMVKRHGMPKVLAQKPELPFITVSPQCPDGTVWPQHLPALKALIDDVVETYAVDSTRIYLTGNSMGGFGTWALASAYPDLFAAIAPICGRGDPEEVCELKDVPVWVFHGDADEVVALSWSEKMVEALRACGGDVRLTVYEGVGHDAWTRTYENPALYAWFLQHRR